jgi:hypothetical protein
MIINLKQKPPKVSGFCGYLSRLGNDVQTFCRVDSSLKAFILQ